MLDIVVTGGEAVTSAGYFRADIGIEGGRIAQVGRPGALGPARQTIDAAGKYVLPGLLDVHLHFKCYSHHLDPFGLALESAALGGVTTVLAMLIPSVEHPKRPLEVIDEFRRVGERDAVVDFGFHVHLAEMPGALEEIPDAIAAGVPSFKIFMAYKSMGRMASDEHLLDAMKKIAAAGGMLLLHAEDGAIIDRRIAEQVVQGRVKPSDFLFTHPPEVEYLAVQKALDMGSLTGCPLYFLHLSTPRAVDMIQEARHRGQAVFLETCPQYLELDNGLLDVFGPLAKVSPPLRTRTETEGLWQAVLQKRIDLVGSDHSSHSAESKKNGYKNIFDCWYGAPAAETMVPVLADGLRRRGRGLSDLVRLLAEEPARVFDLYPQKGSLRPGADADLVIWDPEREVTLTKDLMHCNAGYTLYEGRQVQGWPILSLLRGQVLLDDGNLRAPKGSGQFLARRPHVIREGGSFVG